MILLELNELNVNNGPSFYSYIFDGFPMTSAQVDLMTAASIIPVRVIELACSNMEVYVRSTKDRLDPER